MMETVESAIGRKGTGVPVDRDIHMLLSAEAERVLVVGGADVADGLRLAGHDVHEAGLRASGGLFDAAVLVSPHRRPGALKDQLREVALKVDPVGSIVVVDRPRAAWPDLLGRRDPVDGHRFRRGAYSARRIARTLGKFRVVRGTYLLSVHDQRYRHMVSIDAPRASRRLAAESLWQEALLPLPWLAPLVAALPRRLAVATSPVVAFVAGGKAPSLISDTPDAVAFLGSRTSSSVALVRPGEGSTLVSADQDWSADEIVESARSLDDAGIKGIRVAGHRRVGERVEVEWLPGRTPGSADAVRLSDALGRIHGATARGICSLDQVRFGSARMTLAGLVAAAREAAPCELREVLADLDQASTPVAWMHGDWSARNCRITPGGIGVFDLEFSSVQGSAGFDIGWYLLQPGSAHSGVVSAYESAARRAITQQDLALGLAGMLVRYGPDRALASWREASQLTLR